MLSAFKYRIYPRPEQELRLKRSLLSLCNLYNDMRTKKIEEHKRNGISLTQTDLRAIALEERRHVVDLQLTCSQVCQNVADRVHVAFKNFFKGVARFPKTKKPKRYLSMTYPQSGFKLNSNRGLRLCSIDYVRIFVHRPLFGKSKRLTIKREADGWYAIFITERKAPPRPTINTIPTERIRGADLGLEKFAVLDNSDNVEYPRFLTLREENRHVAAKARPQE